MKTCAKNDFYTFSFPVTFDLLTSNLLFDLLIFSAMFPKLEVSKAFLFRENRRHGMDGQTGGRGATLINKNVVSELLQYLNCLT